MKRKKAEERAARKKKKEEQAMELEMNKSIDGDNNKEADDKEYDSECEQNKGSDDDEDEEVINDEMEEQPVKQETYPLHQWNGKCARYIAYAIDGGILCSQFTLTTMIKMSANITEDKDNIVIS